MVSSLSSSSTPSPTSSTASVSRRNNYPMANNSAHTKYPSSSSINTAAAAATSAAASYSHSQPSSPTPATTKLVSQTAVSAPSSSNGNGNGNAVFEIDERYECEVVNALVSLLLQHGPLSLGKLGSMLHNALSNHLLPSALKRQFGGLQKFIRRHPNRFRIGDDHPYNPHVHIIHNQTFAYPLAAPAANHSHANHTAAATATHSAASVNGAAAPNSSSPTNAAPAVNGSATVSPKVKEAEKNVFLPQQSAVDPSSLAAFNYLLPHAMPTNDLLLPQMLYSQFVPMPQLPLLDYYSLLQYAPFAANGHQHALDLETLQLQLLALQAQAQAQAAAAAQVHSASVSLPPSPTHALSALPSPTAAHGHPANIGVPLTYA